MENYGQFIDIENMVVFDNENSTYLNSENNTIYEIPGEQINEFSIIPLIFNYIMFFIYRIGHV